MLVIHSQARRIVHTKFIVCLFFSSTPRECVDDNCSHMVKNEEMKGLWESTSFTLKEQFDMGNVLYCVLV